MSMATRLLESHTTELACLVFVIIVIFVTCPLHILYTKTQPKLILKKYQNLETEKRPSSKYQTRSREIFLTNLTTKY